MAEYDAPLARTTLVGGYQIVFEAIDPTTRAAVSGVKVQNIGIYDSSGAGIITSGTAPVDDEPPIFIPIPLDEVNAA